MEQQFTATKVELSELDFNIFSVYLSDLNEDAEEHYFLGFQRTLPDTDEDPDEEESIPADEDTGFYVEYNGQENGCYQRASQQAKVSLIELSDTALCLSFTSAANLHQGEINAIGDIPLSKLTVNLNFGAEQREALKVAMQVVTSHDCEFRYTDIS